MRACGVDIATSAYLALALVVNDTPHNAIGWKPKNKKDAEPVKLDDFYSWLVFNLSIMKPDIVAVEQVAGFSNRKVVQAPSRFEGVALLAAKRSGALVINPPASSSRAVVIPGKGNVKKELFFKELRKIFSDFDFGRIDSGGMDKGDALTHALAAPTLLERGRK